VEAFAVDLICLGIVLGFFALSLAMIRLFERLRS